MMDHHQGIWSRAEAKAFVTALFAHVLREDTPKPDWIEAWTERALRIGAPDKVFFAFIEVPSHKARLADERDARPRWPVGHFYSPIASRRELRQDELRIFAKRRSLPGIDLRDAAQVSLLRAMAPFFGTIPFPETAAPPFRYNYANSSYGFGDALIYWAFLNHLRPARILEIGCGFTSALVLDTIDRLGLSTICTFADPYPDLAQRTIGALKPPHSIIQSRVQDLDLGLFEALQAGDLLFIDSTHVLKTGSDVHFELTEVLPRLKPGVIVHFHDIFAGFEYPRGWAIERNHSWNEVYALHLFLQYNTAFRIEFFNDHIAREHADTVREIGGAAGARFLVNPGGGLWLSRV
jgi:hypothetical protein